MSVWRGQAEASVGGLSAVSLQDWASCTPPMALRSLLGRRTLPQCLPCQEQGTQRKLSQSVRALLWALCQEHQWFAKLDHLSSAVSIICTQRPHLWSFLQAAELYQADPNVWMAEGINTTVEINWVKKEGGKELFLMQMFSRDSAQRSCLCFTVSLWIRQPSFGQRLTFPQMCPRFLNKHQG